MGLLQRMRHGPFEKQSGVPQGLCWTLDPSQAVLLLLMGIPLLENSDWQSQNQLNQPIEAEQMLRHSRME